jgi:hypothetical protein
MSTHYLTDEQLSEAIEALDRFTMSEPVARFEAQLQAEGFEMEAPGESKPAPTDDPVRHPSHYTRHPSGVECIEVTRHMGFNLGNAVKYIWRCDLKRDAVEDLRKAIFYLEDEINTRLGGLK